jgi:hypothetical protein
MSNFAFPSNKQKEIYEAANKADAAAILTTSCFIALRLAKQSV